MQIFPETKDPNESKVYSYDWSPFLAPGDKIASQIVVFVDAAGTSSTDAKTDKVSKVRLDGGTALGRATFAIRIVTTGGDTLEKGFGVDIVDSVAGLGAVARPTTLQGRIDEAEQAIHDLAMGKRVVEVWKDGRRLVFDKTSIDKLQAYLADLRADLAAAEVDAGLKPPSRRRAISLSF